jgi:hypothetical protein
MATRSSATSPAHELHVEPSTLARLVKVAENHGEIGLLGPNLGVGLAPVLSDIDVGITERERVIRTCILLMRSCIAELGGFKRGLRLLHGRL